MSYFVIELCSIGGCPLEEASEHRSLNNKIIAILCSGYLFFAYSVFGYYLQVKSITITTLFGHLVLCLPQVGSFRT